MLVQGTRRVSCDRNNRYHGLINNMLLQRDHSKMVLFMLIMAIGVVLQFLQVLVSGWATFISGLFFACLSLYWFLCIYSLYHKIKDESMGRPYV
jgi:fatty-acid desaturase